MRSDPSTLASSSPEPPEQPTELATLNIRSNPASVTVSAQGGSTKTLVLGVIGPASTIAVGHFAGLPVWAIIVICALQVAAAVVTHRWS
jgi:hypothetical protein